MDVHSQNSGDSAQFAEPAGAIPHRTHSHRSQDFSRTGNQPDPLARLLRLAAMVGVSALAMLLLMVGAVKYLQQDWADKNQRARSGWGSAQKVPRTPPPQGGGVPEGGKAWRVPESDRSRFLAWLGGGGGDVHVWLVQGFGSGVGVSGRRRAVLLDLAEHGDGVQFRNLQAALLLKHGDALQAVRQLRLAERLAPGCPATLFNRALCAMVNDLPDQALVWLGRYRARFPDDAQAVRLQFNLLLQLDRADEAMGAIGEFLAGQPASQPLLLDAAVQAAQMNRVGEAIHYLETAQRGQPSMAIARIYQSPAFREIRLSPEGTAFAGRMARRARASLVRASAVQGMSGAEETASALPRIPANPKFH